MAKRPYPTVEKLLDIAYAVGADLEQRYESLRDTTNRRERVVEKAKLRRAVTALSVAVAALENLDSE